MSEAYAGEIRVTSFSFPPSGWAYCNGQLLPISQYPELFAVLGVQYGGDGVTTFALPDLQGRMPIHAGNGYSVGDVGGEAAHTLTVGEMPAHVHPPNGRTEASSPGTSPGNAVWAASPKAAFAGSPDTTMSAGAVADAGGGQPHGNWAPYLTLNVIISLSDVFYTE